MPVLSTLRSRIRRYISVHKKAAGDEYRRVRDKYREVTEYCPYTAEEKRYHQVGKIVNRHTQTAGFRHPLPRRKRIDQRHRNWHAAAAAKSQQECNCRQYVNILKKREQYEGSYVFDGDCSIAEWNANPIAEDVLLHKGLL